MMRLLSLPPLFAIALSVFSAALTTAATAPTSADVVIYGGTSSGIAAALQTARMGKTAVLIEPTQFLGGLTTGGLGATDIGNKRAIGGIAREFYGRIWQHYQNPAVWTRQKPSDYFVGRNQPTGADEKTMWTFEPHVATKVYDDLLREAGAKISIVRGERLDLAPGKGVIKDGTRIVRIVMESGRAFAAPMFIDATYEGDLLAKAGVSYHVGREANAVYGETINGVQVAHTVSHQFTKRSIPTCGPAIRRAASSPASTPPVPAWNFPATAKCRPTIFA